jgi:hypothetical protein
MTGPPGKMRTRAHVLADLGVNYVERQVLLCGFTVERIQHDYGYDLTMSTFSRKGEYEPGNVYIQVKATDRLPFLAGGETISWPVSRRDLKLWVQETYPVVLAVYDGKNEEAYWVHIQAYVSKRPTAELFAGGETIHVRIPVRNRLDPRAFRRIARYKNHLQQQISKRGPGHA